MAFSCKELLVVLAVTGVLVCVQLPALTSTGNQTKVAQCAANLKQYGLCLQLYASDNGGSLPSTGGGVWAWDVARGAVFVLMPNYGLTRQTMYCPGFPQQNIDQMWNYASYTAAGYAATSGYSGVLSDDQNASVSAQQITLSGSDLSLGPAGSIYHIVASQRPLLADATISNPGQTNPALTATYQWTMHTEVGIPGWKTPYGPWIGSSTPHMAGVLPAGGNIGMLDGHVEWRPFTNMIPRTGAYGGDAFWW